MDRWDPSRYLLMAWTVNIPESGDGRGHTAGQTQGVQLSSAPLEKLGVHFSQRFEKQVPRAPRGARSRLF